MIHRLTAIAVFALLAPSARADEAAVNFEGDVKPILRKQCLSCHNAERPRGDLDLSSFSAVMAGGTSGKAVVSGKADNSPLYTMTAHLEDPKMPPNKPKIPQRELDTLRKWIDSGLIEKPGGMTATTTVVKPAVVDGITAAASLARPTAITALAVSPTTPLLVVPGKKQVLVYELPAGKLLGALAFPEGEVHTLRFSRDGKVLIAGGGIAGQSGIVVGFEVATWKRLFAVGEETDAVLAADISTDKTRVVFGGPSRVVKVLSVPDGKVIHTLRKPTDWVMSVGFSPDGLLVAAGDRFGGLFVWDAKSGKEFYTLRGHTKAVTGLAWRADSDALASSSEDGTVRVWNLHTGAETAKWDAHAEGTSDIAFHPTGILATAGRDGRVRVWDQAGKSLGALGPAADAVLKVQFSPDAKTLLTGDWVGDVKAWKVDGGTAVKFPMPVDAKPATVALIPVPTPTYTAATILKPVAIAISDVARKRGTLKAIEEATEKLRDEAARDPKNAALAKAYLQLCEVSLAMKAELLAAETLNSEVNK